MPQHSRRLHEGIEQFRLAQQTLGIVTWIWDTATDRVQWQGDISRMLGLPPKAFSGRFPDYLKQVHPEDAAAARRTFIDCLKGKQPEYRAIERVVWPDGGVHWLETYGRATYGPDGRALRMTGVIKEVTERKREESARLKAEMLLSRVFDASPDYIIIVRAGDGQFLAANSAFERATGYRAQDIVGRTVGEVNLWAFPGERERFLADLTKGGGSVQNRPALVRTRSGAVLSGKMSASLIEHEGERLIVSMMHDITEARRLERRAQQSERKFAALFETSPVGLVVTRPRERRIVEINDAALRLIGAVRDEAIGGLVTEMLTPLDLEALEALRERALRGEPVVGEAANFLRRDGKQVSSLLSMALVDLEGEPHFVISLLDVTEQRRIERARQQAESKYAALFETNPEAVVVTRMRDGLILAQNPACERYSGYRSDQAIGRTVIELRFWVRADDRAAVVGQLEATGGVSNFETRFRRADGREIDVLGSAARIEIDGEACAIWTWRDVSELRETERRAHESERKFAALFENSPEPISLMRLSDEVRIAANSAWERVTGHSRDRASSQPATAMSMFRDPAKRAALIARVAAEGRVSNVDMRLLRADGTEFDAQISAVCIEVDGERCVLWNWRDVSEQRRAEEAVRASEKRLRDTLDNTPGVAVQWFDRTGRIQYWNHASEVLYGVPAAEALGRGFAEIGLHTPEQNREFLAFIAGIEASGSVHGPDELTLRTRDRGEVTVLYTMFMIPGIDGSPTFVCMDVDITERKRNENLLMNVARGVSAELGGAFFRSLAEHLARELVADFAYIGDLTEDGTRMRTLAFLADGAMVPLPDHPLPGSMSEQALAAGRTVIFAQGLRERFLGNEDLRSRGVEAYVGTPLYGADGKAIGVLAVGHRKPIERPQFWASMIEIFGARAAAEIERARAEALVLRTNESLEQTVRERTAELQEANRDLESYNSSISHDLRQPLNAIAGFAELLRDPVTKAIGGMAQECVAEIESNATRMEQMIESLLRLARAGRGALRKAEVDARDLVDGVLHDLSSNAPLGADVVVVGELPAAQGDPVLLRQVWTNLVGNAIKYSRRSLAPRIEISGERSNGAVEYVIRDNGVGFDMQHAARLFGTFQRLPTAAGFEGSGIGLAIVDRIVRRHGGSISAESSPGAGATFRFTLPDTGLS